MRIVLVATILILSACTSPPESLRESGAASEALYSELVKSIDLYERSLTDELIRRDRSTQRRLVATGDEAPIYAKNNDSDAVTEEFLESESPRLGADTTTKGIRANLLLSSQLVRLYQLHYGAISRFLRIEVLDLEDVEEMTERANKASEKLIPADGDDQ